MTGYRGSIGGECAKCGEFFGLKSNRFDLGPDGLVWPDDDDSSLSGQAVDFDDSAETPELQQYCDSCDVWSVWVFDTEEYLETGGEGWPDPVKVYWVADEFWGKNGEEEHFVVVWPEER